MFYKLLIGAGGIAALAFSAVAATAGGSILWTNATLVAEMDVPTDHVETSGDAEVVARGKLLADHVSICAGCHGEDLGGKDYLDVDGLLHIYTPNITSAGVTADYTDDDWVRAIRHGVRPDGTGIPMMATKNLIHLSEADLGAVISYVKTVPPVERELPETEIHLLGRMLWTAGVFELIAARDVDHDQPFRTPERAKTIAYGDYIAWNAGCHDCHGEGLSGGHIAGTPSDFPEPANITPGGIGDWTFAHFNAAVRGGISKDGHQLDPLMPSRRYAGLPDTEMTALWMYIQQVPSGEYGNF